MTFDIYARSSNSEYNDELNKLIGDLDLRDNVTIYEPVASEEIGKLLKCAVIGIVPKRGGLFASEAFSSKILDFMAAGVPVIASRTKIDEYYFDDSMIMFFEPGNYQDLAKCISELYKNPKKREYLVKNAKEFITRNNWELKKEIYYKMIDELISS